MKTSWKITVLVAASLLGAALTQAGCDNNETGPTSSMNFVQVERLGRPAINEGLILTNAFLIAYNSIPPSADLSEAAAPVLAEAAATLTALGNDEGRINALVGAFIPDVMRIDTTIASGFGTAAYANCLNDVGSPCSGRKLEDDVIDITLSVLTNGGVTADNVPYRKPDMGPGSTNPAIGHNLLNGQVSEGGSATFPFLAEAN